MAASSSSSTCGSMVKLLSPRVFVNFRGDELRDNFISHLEKALGDGGIRYFLDDQLVPSDDLETLLKEIEDSQIALAVFSKRYSESKWCLNELVKIMENVEEKKLRVIPIFFKVTVEDVKHQRGEFGLNLYSDKHTDRSNMPKWEKALKSVPAKMGLTSAKYRTERDFIVDIVHWVKKVLAKISAVGEGEGTNIISTNMVSCSSNTICRTIEQPIMDPPLYGIEQRLKQLEDKLFDFEWAENRIVGVVGMPGIGKTTLATKYYNTWNHKVVNHKNVRSIRENSIKHGTHWLKNTLLNGQDFNEEADMFSKKTLYVLDDVSHRDQVKFLYTKREWIKGGSKIVITTRDKSLIEELVDDIYVVPCLNDKEALQLFNSHAYNDETSSATGNFQNLSKGFVEYAEGNPRALEELGNELCGNDEDHWERRLETLPHCCNQNILYDLRISYDKLTDQQKDVFLDIACFFRSEEEDYVKCLLDGSESGEAVRDLTEKYLICISAGRIEMHNLLCTLGKELGSSDDNNSGERVWNHDKAIDVLCSEHVREGKNKVRGIFLDTSKVSKGILGIALDKNTFTKRFDHLNLRYLKIYDSLCPQQCHRVCEVNLPEELEFPFQEIRYLHWLKLRLDELPPDFNPENLIDLRLPYSEIKRVWETAKEAPRLKWVDLSYSTNLTDLSALSKAIDLQRINLEGCTNLSKLPREMKKMKSLVFINLRGCVMLSSLPAKLDLLSLKTLILSGCSNFSKFELYSENLEFLHLDGTAIKSLPATIQNFKKLVLLNLKDCKLLERLPPYCLDKLKALEELILSGCVKLTRFPDIKENMENLQILLLDGTSIEKVPNVLFLCGKLKDKLVCQQPLRMNGVSLLRRLCLSGNHTIRSLGSSISQLYHLKWIDVKDCKKLESISTLPPNLQCLDAHDCISLKTVASPLALLIPTTQQVPSSFIFTNCEKLEYVAKNEIICCAHNKSRLLSEALNRHSKGFASEALVATSLPGSEIPAWFSHRASGAELEPELPPHWSENGFVGIALCAIVSFKDHKTRNKKLQVKCKCVFNNVETSPSNFGCHIGGLSEAGDEERTIKSTHVFIGYTNWLNIKKCQEDDSMKACVPTKGSIKFEVTDGTNEVMNCEILKCGFSLVYESGSWEPRSRSENVGQGGSILLGLLGGIKWFFKLLNYGATATRGDNFTGKSKL